MPKAKTLPEQPMREAIAYLKGEMPEAERLLFEDRMAESEELREQLSEARTLLDALTVSGEEATVRVVNEQITEAIRRGASDLHILPERQEVRIRLRIDGHLHDMAPLPNHLMRPVVDRWKVMADMHVGERRVPQDGRLPIKHTGEDYNLRVNILPTLYGERVTVRILPTSRVLLGLDHLGLDIRQMEALRRITRRGSGMILACGRINQGKTTLLYSLLKEMQEGSGLPQRSILTVEDPVEMSLGKGISQTSVDRRAGLTYPAALRTMLRADAEVVYCAEMRDLETAEIATELALTGRLVLSSLHTASALHGVERLRNMGLENFLIADTLAGLIGLRLVRRTDTTQTEEYQPTEEELERAGLTPSDGPFRRGVPAEANGHTGFKGLVPLIEIIEPTPDLRRRIATGATVEEMWQTAFNTSSGSLRDVARERVRAGLTTVEEVNWALYDYPA